MSEKIDLTMTLLLVVFNGLLALFTYLLYRATAGLWEASKQQSLDIKEQLRIAAEASAATKMAAEAATRSALAAANAAEAAKATFIAAHRPKLLARHVQLFPLDAHKALSIRYEWANVGGTPAYWFESNSTVLIADDLPAVPEYEKGRKDEHDPIKLGTGQFTVTSGQHPIPLLRPEITQIEEGVTKLFLYGYVRYRDEAGTEWSTAFCRRYNPISKRFDRVDDPDFDYAD